MANLELKKEEAWTSSKCPVCAKQEPDCGLCKQMFYAGFAAAIRLMRSRKEPCSNCASWAPSKRYTYCPDCGRKLR